MPLLKKYQDYVDSESKSDLQNWGFDNNQIYRVFKFDSFDDAVLFVNSIATLANQMDHHPDIFLYDYKFVRVSYKSHDKNAVTIKDYKSAHLVDKIYDGEDLW